MLKIKKLILKITKINLGLIRLKNLGGSVSSSASITPQEQPRNIKFVDPPVKKAVLKERVRLTKTTPRRRTQQQPAITRAPLPPIVPILVKRPSLPGQALPQVFSPPPVLNG